MPDVRQITYSEALREALSEEMSRDRTVFVMGEDVARWGSGGGVFGVTKDLVDRYGEERIRDTPISEGGIVGLGVGAAMTGTRPVVEIMYSDFLTLAMDPIVNQAAKARYMFGGQARVPLVIRTCGGASGGKAAQHSQSLEQWFAHVPGLKVLMPRTPADAKGMLKSAIRDDNPVLFLEHKNLYFRKGAVPEGEHLVPIGEASLVREGSDVTVVGVQVMVDRALEAAETLALEGIELEVVDLRSLSPLDDETVVTSVTRTGRLLICHEATEQFGWAGEVAMRVMEKAFDHLDAPIARVGAANTPIPYAESLERAVLPSAETIVSRARALVRGPGYDTKDGNR
jgi:pyruvate dehydrogenase E1 component beta subunit